MENAYAMQLDGYLAIWHNSQVDGGDPMDDRRYRARAEIIKAMAHPSRLAMIDALAEGELCVCELQRIVGSDMSTVSKHLSVMRNAGIVDDRKCGLQVFYRLRVPCIVQFFGCVEAVMQARMNPDADPVVDACPCQAGDSE
jgi:DNA-binding transcriptional ArsR family regulator